MITDKIKKRYKGKTIANLKKIATLHFNEFIRNRDIDERCVSCKKNPVEQAGHFYPAGSYATLKYNEDNVHGQCIHCNKFLSANLILYRRNIPERIGEDGLQELDSIADAYKRDGFKWTRIMLIELIIKYIELNKRS